MKIEELRPLQGHYNADIVPVIQLLRAIQDAEHNTITINEANEVLKPYGKTVNDFPYLVEIITVSEEYNEVTMPIKYYSPYFEESLLENAKVIFKNLEPPVMLYEVVKLLIMRHEVEDIPYILDLLEYNSVIDGLYI